MRVVVALGGNALLRRGQPMTVDNQVFRLIKEVLEQEGSSEASGFEPDADQRLDPDGDPDEAVR